MNDRFKFRVWDKENKCLYHPAGYTNFAIVNGTVIKIESYQTANTAYLGRRIVWEFDDAVIMQSTGLKDKNGKLIYEGDIVKSFHVSSTMQGRVFTGFVAYDDERCRYCISENKHCGYVTFSDTDDVFEVIGNIYENKELLNENS